MRTKVAKGRLLALTIYLSLHPSTPPPLHHNPQTKPLSHPSKHTKTNPQSTNLPTPNFFLIISISLNALTPLKKKKKKKNWVSTHSPPLLFEKLSVHYEKRYPAIACYFLASIRKKLGERERGEVNKKCRPSEKSDIMGNSGGREGGGKGLGRRLSCVAVVFFFV